MKILVTYDMFREGFTELESKYEVTFPEGRDFTYEEVYEMIPEYDVLCSMFDFPVNKELIDHAPKLRLIANYAVGYNNIDVAYAIEKGLTVANTPDPVTAPTANIALGLYMLFADGTVGPNRYGADPKNRMPYQAPSINVTVNLNGEKQEEHGVH